MNKSSPLDVNSAALNEGLKIRRFVMEKNRK